MKLVSEMDGVVSRFPVEKRMPRHVAQRRIGRAKRFKYPDVSVIEGKSVFEWTENFLLGKSVVCGWTAVNVGLIEAFKGNRVRHIVSRVEIPSTLSRPLVEICCMGHELYQVYNWIINSTLRMMIPVTLLSVDQSHLFRKCKRCEEYLKRMDVPEVGY